MSSALACYKKKIAKFNRKWRDGIACQQCGKTPISWHHADPSTKCFSIRYHECHGKSDAEISNEQTKCIPLCASCHSIHHHDKGKHSKINGKRNPIYQKNYRDATKEKAKIYQKNYRDANKEKQKIYQKNYRDKTRSLTVV